MVRNKEQARTHQIIEEISKNECCHDNDEESHKTVECGRVKFGAKGGDDTNNAEEKRHKHTHGTASGVRQAGNVDLPGLPCQKCAKKQHEAFEDKKDREPQGHVRAGARLHHCVVRSESRCADWLEFNNELNFKLAASLQVLT